MKILLKLGIAFVFTSVLIVITRFSITGNAIATNPINFSLNLIVLSFLVAGIGMIFMSSKTKLQYLVSHDREYASEMRNTEDDNVKKDPLYLSLENIKKKYGTSQLIKNATKKLKDRTMSKAEYIVLSDAVRARGKRKKINLDNLYGRIQTVLQVKGDLELNKINNLPGIVEDIVEKELDRIYNLEYSGIETPITKRMDMKNNPNEVFHQKRLREGYD